ncbi:MAG: DNA polymerase III subunit alpha [Gammaproteobacteria bacterium]|nr:DNA polymerase III subunit alpha [Gammaproteobacteria bacterium]
MTDTPRFVHLHLHTEYSIEDGLVRIDDLVARGRAEAMPALAVTDLNNMFALVKFYKAAQQAGIKPIVGAEVSVASDRPQESPSRLLLLCQDYDGYLNLSQLLTRAYLEGRRRDGVFLNEAWLTPGAAAGLIAIGSQQWGDVSSALREHGGERARRRLDWWRTRFGDRYYLELTRVGRDQEEEVNQALLTGGVEFNVPFVASNDVRFINASEYEAHEARVCIQAGKTLGDPRRPRHCTAQQYLRSASEMAALFQDLPDALANSVAIAQRCNFELQLGQYHLPEFADAGPQGVDARLRGDAAAGLLRRWRARGNVLADDAAMALQQLPETYRGRLQLETEVIAKMGFSGYFLIVADFIAWAKAQGIPVGPGRGSGVGSLVAYALGITELDPIRFDLLFERFLNPERVSMPDFDVDFCMERRDEVIEYVMRRYGGERVAQIITYGTMAAKASVRDCGRVLGHAYSFVDQIAKTIPFELHMTLTRALDESPELKQKYDEDEDVRAIVDLALQLEGLTRNAGRHAGGVVISPRPLTSYMPLYCEQDGAMPVTQFDMGDVESVGLVKFDFLGLRTLTIIDWALKDINAARIARAESPIDINLLPLDDVPTYALIRSARTSAVFQLESRVMKDLIRRMKPEDSFEDLIALVALIRPGPSGMIDEYIDRKHGKTKVIYPHPLLEPILRTTNGIMLYQEQVMQIAQVLAGYSLGAADTLRRAMGKKKPEEMAKHREKFVAGAALNGVAAELAAEIFDLMEKFAGYGFNKSHSAAYALVAYQTAWLKAHHPAAFMAAVLSSDMDHTDKVIAMLDECRRLGLAVERPDINHSAFRFTVSSAKGIRYGLGAIKGIGRNIIEAITEERERLGSFHDLFEFCRRVGPRRLNKRSVEVLIRAGACDGFQQSRRYLSDTCEAAMRTAEQQVRRLSAGQEDMFDAGAGTISPVAATSDFLRQQEEWPDEVRLRHEKEALGHYVSGHPIARYAAELRCVTSCSLQELKPGRRVVAGLVDSVRLQRGKRGRYAIVMLDDGSARADVNVYAELLEGVLDKLVQDTVILVEGNAGEDRFSGECTLTAEKVFTIDEVRRKYARNLILDVDAGDPGCVDALRTVLAPYRNGQCPVVLTYRRDGAIARIRLGAAWCVEANDALLADLRRCFGGDRVALEY